MSLFTYKSYHYDIIYLSFIYLSFHCHILSSWHNLPITPPYHLYMSLFTFISYHHDILYLSLIYMTFHLQILSLWQNLPIIYIPLFPLPFLNVVTYSTYHLYISLFTYKSDHYDRIYLSLTYLSFHFHILTLWRTLPIPSMRWLRLVGSLKI